MVWSPVYECRRCKRSFVSKTVRKPLPTCFNPTCNGRKMRFVKWVDWKPLHADLDDENLDDDLDHKDDEHEVAHLRAPKLEPAPARLSDAVAPLCGILAAASTAVSDAIAYFARGASKAATAAALWAWSIRRDFGEGGNQLQFVLKALAIAGTTGLLAALAIASLR